MSAPTQLRGKAAGKAHPELRRFKYFWRDDLSDAQRDAWRARFYGGDSQAVLRAAIKSELGFNLKYDKQLTYFKQWDEEQLEIEAEEDRQQSDELRIRTEHPDWDDERLRQEVINCSYRRALARGDFKLGLQTISADAKLQGLTLDRSKFEFDATKAALAKLPELKAIAANKSLSEDEKLEQARLQLFGMAPK